MCLTKSRSQSKMLKNKDKKETDKKEKKDKKDKKEGAFTMF